jgi:hypothetical protein
MTQENFIKAILLLNSLRDCYEANKPKRKGIWNIIFYKRSLAETRRDNEFFKKVSVLINIINENYRQTLAVGTTGNNVVPPLVFTDKKLLVSLMDIATAMKDNWRKFDVDAFETPNQPVTWSSVVETLNKAQIALLYLSASADLRV